MFCSRMKSAARHGLAATLAAALAISPITATPAQAGDENKVGAIAAVSLLALLTAGIVVANANDSKDQAGKGLPRMRDGRNDTNRHQGGYNHPPRGTWVDPRKLLPDECDLEKRVDGKVRTYYPTRCLKNEFAYWPYLPERCETRIKDWGGRKVSAYDGSCLARYGYINEDDVSRWGRR